VPAAGTALNQLIQNDTLRALPTFAQWIGGASSVPGWKLATNQASLASQTFECNGWP
jgi:hypothetical protein